MSVDIDILMEILGMLILSVPFLVLYILWEAGK